MLFSAVACDTARTSSDAPDSVEESPVVEDTTEVEETLEDADSELRQAQLDSDIRAREERNDLFGEPGDGNVAIVGTVPSQKEYESIEPLAQEILGVDNVKMEVKIVPSTEQ